MEYDFICDIDKVDLLEFTFRLDETDDYVNSRIMMRFHDGKLLDSKQADLDFVPDELIEDIVRLVEWLEKWNGKKVFTLNVYHMNRKEGKFSYIITARGAPKTRIGRFVFQSDSMPEEIREIVLKWWDDMLGAYGHRAIGIGIPLGDTPPPDVMLD